MLALANGLLSVKALNHRGISVNLDSGVCTIYNQKTGTVLAQSKGGGNPYNLHISCPEPALASIAHSPTCMTLDLIHKHLGHPSANTLKNMVKKGLVTGVMVHNLESTEGFICDACI